jgi:ribose transport system ATP-binding protein
MNTDRAAAPARIAAHGIDKRFGPVPVLFGIDFELIPGEIHAVVGENGAGKSTLMKILAGLEQPSAGEVRVDGTPVALASVAEAERLGIVLVHQELNLAEHLSVAENVFLGHELTRFGLLDREAMRMRTSELLTNLGSTIDPRERVDRLAVPDRQMVEIAKALARDVRVLLLDEPTAVLTPNETEALFEVILRMRERGVAIELTSHKLNEVERVADRITVLRDGRKVASAAASELSQHEVARLMVGREVADLYPDRPAVPDDAPVALAVRGLSVPGHASEVSFEVRRGEVLGFFGLVGAGRTEMFEGLLGLRPRTAGQILREGREIAVRSLREANAAGIGYLTEDRKGRGLLLNAGLAPNLTLQALGRFGRVLIDQAAEGEALEVAIRRFDIRVRDRTLKARALSGGNQQKLLLAKMLETAPEVLVFDEPTRGIDIGTKQQFYRFIHDLAQSGKACVVISSEMQEVIGLCHRVIVMRLGRKTGELSGAELTEAEIVQYAVGLKGEASDATEFAA